MKEKTIPALPENHKHTAIKWITTKAPTCTVSGTLNAICSCGKTIETKEIASKGHTTVIDKTVAATCTSEGLTQGSHCSVCNTVILKQTSVAKIDHTFVNGTCNCGTIESLKFTLSSDSKYYILSGIGTYTKTDIVIPEKYNGLPVKEIAANAFHSNTTITSVKFNNSVEKIGNYAFFRCKNLAKALHFPSVLKEIGECAFKDCSNITAVEFGPSLQIIGYAAFQNCSQLKTLTIPASVNNIDKYAFKNCSSITDVYFEKTTTWTCYHSTYPASTMGEAALSYSKGACSFLVNSYNDRLWKRS